MHLLGNIFFQTRQLFLPHSKRSWEFFLQPIAATGNRTKVNWFHLKQETFWRMLYWLSYHGRGKSTMHRLQWDILILELFIEHVWARSTEQCLILNSRIAQWTVYSLRTQRPRVWILAFMKCFAEKKIVHVAKVFRRHCCLEQWTAEA